MYFKEIFLLLLLAHVIGDFYLQTEKMAENKTDHVRWVLIHCLVYWAAFVIAILPVFNWSLVLYGFLTALLHMGIDMAKYAYTSLSKKKVRALRREQYIFLTDQLLHISVLFFMAYYYTVHVASLPLSHSLTGIFSVTGLSKTACISWITALLLIHKPVNIAISKILIIFKPENKDADREQVHNAGRLIGTIERLIMLIFISLGQYAAIGLVLTAKSIARYDKIVKEPAFAEYYLLGTLLSTVSVIIISFVL